MILEKMPTGKLESLRAEVEAMIASKVAERREELQSQLYALLEITGHGNGTRRGQGKARSATIPPLCPKHVIGDFNVCIPEVFRRLRPIADASRLSLCELA